MRASFPVSDPGTPDHRGPARYLWWLAGLQRRTITAGIALAVVWMVSQALMPAVIGRALDDGLLAGDTGALAGWSAALLGLGVVQAIAGVLRHRCVVVNWLAAAYRTVQVVVRQATRLGATLPKRLAAGEVVSVGTTDIEHIGSALDITARASGALVGIVVVVGILLATAPPLGVVALVGLPLATAAVFPLLRPLHRRQQRYRELQGELTTTAGDVIAGLRVLRGVGGEAAFSARYRAESQRARAAGVAVGSVDALLRATRLLLPSLFIVAVTWLGARFALAGRLTPGELVACYAYTVFLLHPLTTLAEAADKITRGLVAARRVVRVLALEPEFGDGPAARPLPPGVPGDLVDIASGLLVRPGRLTALACADPRDALAIADRLGGFAAGEVRYGGVPLARVTRADLRRRILLVDNDARLFSGRLRDQLAPAAAGPSGAGPSGAPGGERLRDCLRAACAEEIVAGLPDGLDTEISDRGREFSGGQLQRLRLVRALVADPEVLILVEPTSAVDAHTEARIGARLARARAGSTTLVCTTSPLLLRHADQVAFVADGVVVGRGGHHDLLATEPRYAATVGRGAPGGPPDSGAEASPVQPVARSG